MYDSANCVKTKGVIIIPVKFRSGRELLALKCFIIFYTQMFSSFENWDIQDLTLSIFFFQRMRRITLIVRTKFLLRNFQTKRVIMKIAMMKIFNNCIADRLHNYFPFNESSSLYCFKKILA